MFSCISQCQKVYREASGMLNLLHILNLDMISSLFHSEQMSNIENVQIILPSSFAVFF